MIKQSNNGQFTIPTGPAAGTTVAQSASANTYGSYVALTASTGEADAIIGIRLFQTSASAPGYVSIAIGTGGAGSETQVGEVSGSAHAIASGTNIGCFIPISPPIYVANATRIATKTASSTASALSWSVALVMAKQADLIDAGINESSNVTQANGTNVTTATAGVLGVDVTRMNNVAATSITTINANQGTTQPINFTGTGASALAKSDMVDVAGAAVSATTAQIGVNVVNWNNTVVATPATAGIPDVNVKNINNVVAATPGAAGGLFIAGTNAATTINGTAAAGATPATAGLTLVGGAASTTGGGVSAPGFKSTGGAGAASTNGAAEGTIFSGGGTNTIASTATGFKCVGTSTGHGQDVESGTGSTGDGFHATSNATSGKGSVFTGNGTGHGMDIQSGAGASGNALNLSANSTNGDGISTSAIGVGTGNGIHALAGGSGVGINSGGVTTGALSCTTITASGTTSLAAVTTSGTVTFNAFTVTNTFTVSGATTLTGAITGTNASNDLRTNVFKINSVSAASVTTINANIGMTQPVNFSGTGATAFVKSDVEQWVGVAPNALISGRVDANTQATAASLTFNLTGNITGNLTGSVGSVTGAVGSVTGAVGSVTGNVGGNVTGSVGSVIAAVALSAGDSPVLQSGTASAGGASTITIQTALGHDNLPNHCIIKITSGTGAKQARTITLYVDSTKVVTVERPWDVVPDNTSVYSIIYDSVGGNVNNVLGFVAGDVQGNLDGFVTGNVVGNVLGSVNSVVTDVGITQAAADKVWLSASRTLTAFGFSVTVGTNNDKTGYSLDLTQAVPASNTANTTGDAFHAARVQGFGKWVIDLVSATKTLTLYESDNVTIAKTFTLTVDGSGNPTARMITQGYGTGFVITQGYDGLAAPILPASFIITQGLGSPFLIPQGFA